MCSVNEDLIKMPRKRYFLITSQLGSFCGFLKFILTRVQTAKKQSNVNKRFYLFNKTKVTGFKKKKIIQLNLNRFFFFKLQNVFNFLKY